VKKIFFLFLLLFSISIFAQKTDSTSASAYLKSYFTDSRDIIIAPFRWNKKQWLTFGSISAGTFLIHLYDADINNYFQSKQTKLGEDISKYGLEPFGSGVYSMSGMFLFYTQGLIWKNQRSKKVALLGVKAYLLSGLFAQIPKFLINRHRPYHDTPANPNLFEGPSSDVFHSFPSGHTTSAFAVASVIANEYSETIWVPILSYSLASMVGVSRMYDNKHWASDVLFGAAFGWSIGKLVQKSRYWHIQMLPYSNGETTGLLIRYSLN